MATVYENDLATELRLGLPSTTYKPKKQLSSSTKRYLSEMDSPSSDTNHDQQDSSPASNSYFLVESGVYLEKEGYTTSGSDYVLTYEDKDGDWMLVGDVPLDMFISSCKRHRIMKGSEAKGLARL
ncbi:hypothetical protein RND71_030994 [Anisodus tanguticus]|uniref:Auxin-responsive protein n=1 Tax=Anisodus tanguticus TaxID=243964 RepID=A0AAE1RIG3_9SOLA|nr:hypothetical protein RND71_030994 [Anisodus tanguticus]